MNHLDTLRQRGHTLELTPDGKVFHRGPAGATDEIREHLDEIKAALRAEASAAAHPGSPTSLGKPEDATARKAQDCDLHAPDVSRRLPGPGITTKAGTGETRALIAWFEAAQERLPARPFDLYPHLHVVEPARFYSFLSDWIADGEKSPHPGLTGNLRRLREVVTKAQDDS